MPTTSVYVQQKQYNIMKKEIRLTVKAPVECTDEQFQEWAEYRLGYSGYISANNPLHGYDLEASDIDVG